MNHLVDTMLDGRFQLSFGGKWYPSVFNGAIVSWILLQGINPTERTTKCTLMSSRENPKGHNHWHHFVGSINR